MSASEPLDPPLVSLSRRLPEPRAALTLIKPVTWFAPVWAMACGVVSSGVAVSSHLGEVVGALLLAGPLVCGTSQAANDWFDRHVDAINEPDRPIPSGRVPGRWGLWIALIGTALSLQVALSLGGAVVFATVVGLVLAWAYSAPPVRLKMNGWFGNTAVGLCYEGLPWFTGAAALSGAMPDARITTVALLYSAGAFGIMILNDFKAIEGDEALGIRTIPVQLGVTRAVRLACVVMAVPQVVVAALLIGCGAVGHAACVVVVLVLQLALMPWLMRDPRAHAPAYNASGTSLYVAGMMISAFALRGLG